LRGVKMCFGTEDYSLKDVTLTAVTVVDLVR